MFGNSHGSTKRSVAFCSLESNVKNFQLVNAEPLFRLFLLVSLKRCILSRYEGVCYIAVLNNTNASQCHVYTLA